MGGGQADQPGRRLCRPVLLCQAGPGDKLIWYPAVPGLRRRRCARILRSSPDTAALSAATRAVKRWMSSARARWRGCPSASLIAPITWVIARPLPPGPSLRNQRPQGTRGHAGGHHGFQGFGGGLRVGHGRRRPRDSLYAVCACRCRKARPGQAPDRACSLTWRDGPRPGCCGRPLPSPRRPWSLGRLSHHDRRGLNGGCAG
jgi:hypothetical protein